VIETPDGKDGRKEPNAQHQFLAFFNSGNRVMCGNPKQGEEENIVNQKKRHLIILHENGPLFRFLLR
jgi:hypothetical protein